MVAPILFQFLQRDASLRRYRSMLRNQVQQEPALRLLPALLSLPVLPPHSLGAYLAATSAKQPHLAVRGPLGSGRSLTLLQIAAHWSAHGRSTPVIFLPLARHDALNLPPRAVLAGVFHRGGLPVPFDSDAAPSTRPWLLLIDDWELLPSQRRVAWCSFIAGLPQLWPAARVMITLPSSEPAWPQMHTLDLGTPGKRVGEWLAHLLPTSDSATLLAALESDRSLAAYGQRLQDLALLALTYPTLGLPTSRAQLYERAETLLHASAVCPTQTSDGRHFDTPPQFQIGWLAFQSMQQARSIAATGDLTPLAELDAIRRAEVAVLLAESLADPQPLFAMLWGKDERPDPADLLTLSQCLAARPNVTAYWWRHILTALAEYPADSPQQQALEQLTPLALAYLLQSSTAHHPDAQALLIELAPVLGALPLLALLDNPALPTELRWAAADGLARLPAASVGNAVQSVPPPDALSQAGRAWSVAIAYSTAEQAPAPLERTWIEALPSATISLERHIRLISELLNSNAIPADLRSLALTLLDPSRNPASLELLVRSCADPAAAVRTAARMALERHDTAQVLAALQQVVCTPDLPWATRRELLDQVAHYREGAAAVLLTRCIIAPNLPLIARLYALDLLAQRPMTAPVLRRLSAAPALHPAVRAQATHWLGQLPIAQEQMAPILAELAHIAISAAPLVLRQSAIAALGKLGARATPDDAAIARAGISAVLEQAETALEIAVAALEAMGTLGAAESIPLLGTILSSELVAQRRAVWFSHNPQLAELPVIAWLNLELPATLRTTLLTRLSEGVTDADQPSTLNELSEQEASRLRIAAATALVQIGSGGDAEVRQAAHSALWAALHSASEASDIRHLLDCLAHLSDDAGLHDLEQLLNDSSYPAELRWLAIEQLGVNSICTPLLLRFLEQGGDELFIVGKIVQVLGEDRALSALPTLCRIAGQTDGNLYLRNLAVAALGNLGDPAALGTLVQILTDQQAAAALRGAAAVALPQPLDASTCQILRDLLNHDRQPPDVVAGVLHVLGQVRDHEALPMLLRYAQSEQPTEAVSALQAIAALGDTSVTPWLVRITQHHKSAADIRLQAIAALLQLCGTEYLPLLHDYLLNSLLPLRIQALDYLLALCPDHAWPLISIGNKQLPLNLRLRCVAALSKRVADHQVLYAVLLDHSDALQLRIAVATALGQNGGPAAITALTECAQAATTAPRLCRCCIAALAMLARQPQPAAALAQYALSQIAEDPSQPDTNQLWALWGLSVATQGEAA